MALPPADELFEHLVALRDADDPVAPLHAARWRAVDAWLQRAFASVDADADDRRQETLMVLMRHVGAMRADTPLGATKWVSTIYRNKRYDALRSLARDPVSQGLATTPEDPQREAPVDQLEAEAPAPPPHALEEVVTRVLEHVHRALEGSVSNPGKRALRRLQAQAALLRLVCGWDADAIAEALDHGEPLGRDRVYKWVERGRAPALEGLDAWEASADADEAEAIGPALVELREMIGARRADAGRPRVHRRGGEGGA